MFPSRTDVLSEVWRDNIFRNKVVFCTGGAGSICSVQVRALVLLGANAAIVGRNPEKTRQVAADIARSRDGAKVIGIGGVDVRKPESITAAAAKCAEELGAIDFVIAGAAGNFVAPISRLSANAFKSVIDIDLTGSYNTFKATVPYLLRSALKHRSADSLGSPLGTGGRIIFISATLHYAGTPFQAHVGAGKAGVDSLSSSIAIEYGPMGITSNVIAPGPISDTEGMRRLAAADGEKTARKGVPLGRWGRKKEIADATIYLFSDTGNFINGTLQVVDGAAWRLGALASARVEYPEALEAMMEGTPDLKPFGAGANTKL
ncbi:hypothetical protein ETB97_011415 [Aspergillus alliaceus]|uniref:2,4-dienoyl-CoA reductase [(3E)-enoyl-CoA-producing] n=1 Tax=Petromyces alliaceus TaxID=209559 RepID=A0A5N6FJA7_PETAA|nr:NAD(P)-binding protein [Aspergillus alliaceus]KAB8229687.1 NAD(P)-binding protein [Aspergillus alliaceus]KAF5866530.1 hypothetical protein ETB97_011415 [Aspergillus burnettii]